MLATVTEVVDFGDLLVTTTADVVDAFDGETSLREAIELANDPTALPSPFLAPIFVIGIPGDADGDGTDNDTITFDPSLAGQTITLNSALPCLLYTSPSPRDQRGSRMPSSA